MTTPATSELYLDRVEGEVAVLVHEGAEVRLPRALLPPGAQEGDVLRLSLTPDPAATQKARERVAQKRLDLGKKDDGGDFSL
jgi:hypothetical protein